MAMPSHPLYSRPEHGHEFNWHPPAQAAAEPASIFASGNGSEDAFAEITAEIRRVVNRSASEIKAAIESGRK